MEGIVLNELANRSNRDDKMGKDSPQLRADSAHLVASLEILQSDNFTNETLQRCMERNLNALTFLQRTANYWPEDREGSTCAVCCGKHWLHQIIYLLCKGLLIILFVILFTFMTIILADLGRSKSGIISMTIDVTMCVDIVSIVIAQQLNQARLLQPAQTHDQAVIDESVRISNIFLWMCVTTIVVSSLLVVVVYDANAIALLFNLVLLIVGGVCISVNMAFNMFFLIMDLKVSSLLLDQLDILADKQVLNLKQFNMVRQDIHRRVNNSKWAADFIAAPCLASVVSILIILFNLGSGQRDVGIAWMFAIIKELLFISVAFWYVAKVNGKADALTVKLSTASWVALDELEEANMLETSVADSQAYRKAVLGDLNRLSVHASSVSQPISYTLLFKRVSWQNVAVSAAGFVVTIMFGVINVSVERAAVH